MRRSTERLFADVAHAVMVLDPADDRIQYANSSGCRLLGYQIAELLATPISSIYREQAPELDAFLARVFEYGHGWTKSLSLLTSGGTSIPAEIFAMPIERGARPLVLVLAADRSQHRQPRLQPPAALA